MKSYEVVGSDGSVVLATDDPSEAYTLKNNTNDKLSFDRRPYFVRQILSPTSESHTTTMALEAYRFWFRPGYAFYYLDHETGVFSIYSDWGNYSYCWPRKCLKEGESLIQFIKSADASYLAGKLILELPEGFQRKQFSLKRSISYMKHLICDERRRHRPRLTAARAREAWDWLDSSDMRLVTTDKEYFDTLMDCTVFVDEFCDEITDSFAYNTSDDVIFLRETLITFFKKFLDNHYA